MPSRAQIITRNPDGTNPLHAGRSGALAAVKYSFNLPGGADTLSFTVKTRPLAHDPALAVGRRVTVHAGPRPVWDGTLDEPVPGEDGWQVTAHGAGTFGSQFQAWWGSGPTWAGKDAPNAAIDNAITAGLRWVDGGDLDPQPPAGGWMGQAPDNGSLTIADMLDLICSRGGLTWIVRARARGNVLNVVPLPTAVTRLLVATSPVSRTVAGTVTSIRVRYCASGGASPTYSTKLVENASLKAKYGVTQKYLDLGDAGTDADGSAATAVCNQILKRYVQAQWGGPFTVGAGDYLTPQGVPVTLGCEQAMEVVRVAGADYGGQDSMGLPATFTVGRYEYDDDTGTAEITPFGAVRTDWDALVASVTLKPAKDDPFGVKTK